MCGICGIIHHDADRPVSEERLTAMRDAMTHRGPDDAGIFVEGQLGLGHRRLSILDLSVKGRQPMADASGRYTIVFNGEVYNYRELRSQHFAPDHPFRSNTDTEVLLELYHRLGADMLPLLNGMWALAIWDHQERTLFATRDRVGIKPFYYSIHDGAFLFASEQKALLTAGVPKTIDPARMDEQLFFRSIAGEATLYDHISRLLPGHCLYWKDGNVRTERWWNLPDRIARHRETLPTDPYHWFQDTFHNSVAYRTIADVPFGVLLSGGLDSSSVAGTLHSQGFNSISSFTVSFDDKGLDETPLARQVADAFGYPHHTLLVTGQSLLDNLRQATWFHDEPLIHQNDPHLLAISKLAKQHVTILLSGEGGDELMGGYVRYKPLQLAAYKGLLRLATGTMRRVLNRDRIHKLHRYFSLPDVDSLVLFNASNLYPSDFSAEGIELHLDNPYRRQMVKEARELFPKEAARAAMYVDVFTHMASVLDRNDRMTMGASIECRVPFLDYKIVERVGSLGSEHLLKGKKGKHLLYNSVGQKLPGDILNFKKLGFSVPWRKYLMEDPELWAMIDAMPQNDFLETGILKHINKRDMISRFRKGDPFAETIVRQLLMLHVWHQEYYTKF